MIDVTELRQLVVALNAKTVGTADDYAASLAAMDAAMRVGEPLAAALSLIEAAKACSDATHLAEDAIVEGMSAGVSERKKAVARAAASQLLSAALALFQPETK